MTQTFWENNNIRISLEKKGRKLLVHQGEVRSPAIRENFFEEEDSDIEVYSPDPEEIEEKTSKEGKRGIFAIKGKEKGQKSFRILIDPDSVTSKLIFFSTLDRFSQSA